ncbi:MULTISPECIES: GGDEF domain-containing protein [Streptomyces]|uniref:GGDEF domain-containing protein n=1 Tax=Streptomyces TaxID=1883 RepID=UPI0003A502CC|nr:MULTISPECIES: GGDEF domain-containing protein [Streptomyces]MBZ6128547.1 GGDEF domain-containing protein [Streptomyces olivaceus]MBZ6162899.1 GGDEF domain-containing protein [Streptomyces olivaceus]MBZ6190702.1 GGDEF domain-containing protein [Streptomyces olivaceus]MBZ6211994.1 GGDEF domain-containing protein [Streptomyces olivaceus]MBZ6225389.1 GGDEF domain-containing protein [Streptomyces olivaceus]
MPALTPLRQPSRAFVLAAAVPLALAALADDVRVRRQLDVARRDPLTGLHQRDSYTVRARQIIGRHRTHALVVLADVDHFKQINDTHGHGAGDRVLEATAQRLTAWAGSHGAAGRLGGDEFTATVRLAPAQRHARLLQLAAALAEPVDVGGYLVDVNVSIGAADPGTIGTTDLSLLQRAADAAMYAGKHTGRPVLADCSHATAPSVNGRRLGRPGATSPGAAA